jgi:ankyrin repeat protein
METIEHNNGRALEGSCHWLQEDTAFKDWLDGHGSQILWIRGDPGKGKTTLAISVVRMLSEKITIQGPSSGTLLASYFCDNKDNRRNSLVALLRGLMYQVLRERPHLSSHFRAVYEREEDRLFTSPNVLQSLWRTLKAILASPGIDTVYIVVDALDELEEESIGDLLKLLHPFINPHPSSSSTGSLQSGSKSAQGSASSLKWLLTSRNVPHIAHMLRQAPGISLEANADRMQDAVSNFIDARIDELQNLKGYNDKLAAHIKDTLREKSEGTFLYVSVSCRALSQPSIGRINAKRVLSEFPRGLTPLYGRIMDQIRNIQDADLADCSARVLRALVLALRPLSVMELAVAANLPEDCHDDPDVLDEYISLCGSFVTLRQGTVHLVHETVKAYLQSIQELFSRPIHEYHAQLTDSFIHSFRGSRSSWSDSEEEPDAVSRGPTLLEYPSLFWMHHARQSGSATDWEQHLTSGLLERDSPTRQAWLERYWSANHQCWEKPLDRFSRLSLACYGGIPNLVSAILDRTDAVDEADSNGYTPLIWAARNGHAHVVELLISHGASCDAQGEDSTTAVIWAAIHGQQGAVEQLISAGASVQTADSRGWTPLHHAAAHGRVEILSSLLAAGADIDAKDVSQQTALQRAVFCADLPIIKALVKEKASLDVRDKDGLSFMHLVARDGHVELLDFWLNLEGRLNGLELVDDQAWTPLMHAAWFGNHEITVRLVRKGANIEARSVDGNTPLHLATSNGHEQVVRDLLEEGANPASTCNMRETPLHQAAWAGHANICLMLLERKVDAGTESESGLTPLHQAAANGHEEVVNLLLDWGADPNLVDAAGKTPSSLAEENQHHLLAQLLRDQELAGNDPHDDSTGVVQIGGAEELDHAIAELLEVPRGGGIAQPHGKPGFSRPTKVTALIDGVTRHYFLKSGPSAEMFEGKSAAPEYICQDLVPLSNFRHPSFA